MDKELQDLETLVSNNRSAFMKTIVAQQEAMSRTQEFQVDIISYDANLRAYKIHHTNGDIEYAKAISNSGNLHKGAKVSLGRAFGSLPMIDAMPRG